MKDWSKNFNIKELTKWEFWYSFNKLINMIKKTITKKFLRSLFTRLIRFRHWSVKGKIRKEMGKKWRKKKTYDRKNSKFLLQAQQKIEHHHKRGNIIEKNQKKTWNLQPPTTTTKKITRKENIGKEKNIMICIILYYKELQA